MKSTCRIDQVAEATGVAATHPPRFYEPSTYRFGLLTALLVTCSRNGNGNFIVFGFKAAKRKELKREKKKKKNKKKKTKKRDQMVE